jgi:hypothetical protein
VTGTSRGEAGFDHLVHQAESRIGRIAGQCSGIHLAVLPAAADETGEAVLV